MTRITPATLIDQQINELRQRKQRAAENNDYTKVMSYDNDIARLRIAKDGLYR